MNMDNISFCFNFFKINRDMCTLLMCFYIQVQKRSWHILTIWTILLTVYPLFQDQMDTFFYFHRDCTQVHQAVLTHSTYEYGQYLSLFIHFLKINMDGLNHPIIILTCPSPYERSWHIILETLHNVSFIINIIKPPAVWHIIGSTRGLQFECQH